MVKLVPLSEAQMDSKASVSGAQGQGRGGKSSDEEQWAQKRAEGPYATQWVS